MASPGMAISVAPSPHYLWLEDYEYYDQLGRDPLQRGLVWGIKDDAERVEKVKVLLKEFPKMMHRRKILFKAARRGDEAIVRLLIAEGVKVVKGPEDMVEGENDDEDEDSDEDMEDEDENEDKDDGEDGEGDEEMTDAEGDDNDEEGSSDGDKPDEEAEGEEQKDGESDTDLEDKWDDSVVPLHVAANHGRISILKIFIEEAQIPIETLDDLTRTPLLAAASELEAMRYLLSKGADPTARTKKNSVAREWLGYWAGADVLEMAIDRGGPEAVRMLIEHPKFIEKYKKEDGSLNISPLAIKSAAAADKGGFESLKLLLETAGYSLPTRSGRLKSDLTPEQKDVIKDAAEAAITNGDFESTKLLLGYLYPSDANGNVLPFDVPDNWHKPFIYAHYFCIEHDRVEKFEWLMSFGLREHDSMSMDGLPEGHKI